MVECCKKSANQAQVMSGWLQLELHHLCGDISYTVPQSNFHVYVKSMDSRGFLGVADHGDASGKKKISILSNTGHPLAFEVGRGTVFLKV